MTLISDLKDISRKEDIQNKGLAKIVKSDRTLAAINNIMSLMYKAAKQGYGTIHIRLNHTKDNAEWDDKVKPQKNYSASLLASWLIDRELKIRYIYSKENLSVCSVCWDTALTVDTDIYQVLSD